METDFGIFFLICIIILAVLTFLCLIKAIKGPLISDRILMANMIGTFTIAIIALLAIYIDESYIIDICLIYAVISFLAVIVITKIYIGLYREKKVKEGSLKEGEDAGTIFVDIVNSRNSAGEEDQMKENDDRQPDIPDQP